MTWSGLLLLGTAELILLRSLIGSAWAYFADRKRRRFWRAQREADRLQRRVGLSSPRDRHR